MTKCFFVMTIKNLYTFMVVFLLGAGIAACSDDDSNITYSSTAETDAQGSFNGTFIRVQVGTTDTLTATGTLVITATDTLNRAYISFTSDELTELTTSKPIPVNIAHADQGFMFYNKSGDYAVVGRINDSQAIRTTFTKAVRSGRSTRRYNYEFTGMRN